MSRNGKTRRGCRGEDSSSRHNQERSVNNLQHIGDSDDLIIDSALADNHPELEPRIGGSLSIEEAKEYDIL